MNLDSFRRRQAGFGSAQPDRAAANFLSSLLRFDSQRRAGVLAVAQIHLFTLAVARPHDDFQPASRSRGLARGIGEVDLETVEARFKMDRGLFAGAPRRRRHLDGGKPLGFALQAFRPQRGPDNETAVGEMFGHKFAVRASGDLNVDIVRRFRAGGHVQRHRPAQVNSRNTLRVGTLAIEAERSANALKPGS